LGIGSVVRGYELLNSTDLRILRIIEVAHRRFEYVPLQVIVDWYGKGEGLVTESLSKLNSLGMVVRSRGSYTGYRLTYTGYDALAIHTLAKANIVVKLSPTPIGVGKESEVYAGESPSGDRLVVKFHRLGRTSFRNVKRLRRWMGDRRHITWLYGSRLSAHTEYKALELLLGTGVNVPTPLGVNRHALVMRYIEGIELFKYSVEDPEEAFWSIVRQLKYAWNVGIVHGDLSEFNIMVDIHDDELYIIDWPQWVPNNSLGASLILRRDVENVITFFKRRYGLDHDIEEIIRYITGGMEIKERSFEEALSELIGEEGIEELIGEDFED